jgi:hypothetical protein
MSKRFFRKWTRIKNYENDKISHFTTPNAGPGPLYPVLPLRGIPFLPFLSMGYGGITILRSKTIIGGGVLAYQCSVTVDTAKKSYPLSSRFGHP